jgi:hypothetical protein
MKPFFCSLVILLSGCTAQSYFKSPNDVRKQKVVLYLRNKPGLAGSLTVPFEENFNKPAIQPLPLKFTPEGDTREDNIDLKDVIGYSLGKDYYALKNLFLFTDNAEHLLFAKRMTGEDSRIQLYELYESGKGNATAEPQYSYFISLPTFSQNETLNTHSINLIPDFDQKMSELVSDCPSLAQKIKNKQTGYFIPLSSFKTFKHKEVMTKIINEYNNCK